ncbi:Alpha/Beta hydrolase protein [Mariannaea sp. PMI_226]|nr:Alpha/Beta hydrolase protein [Mariannaea sp. PMI_226]
MSQLPTAPDLSRFDQFEILRTTYKTVLDHDIAVYVLVPKQVISQPDEKERRPLLLRIHGGGWITASAIFPDWFPPWVLELAARHSAVIVTPDYRLLPEATMDDIVEDMEDFWNWVHDKLPTFILEKTNGAVPVDTSRIMTAGDSAGGWLSLQLGLSHPDEIRAVTAAYPVVDTKSTDFTEPRTKPITDAPLVPVSVFDEHREKIRKGEIPSIISADETLARLHLMHCFLQNGLLPEFFPPEKRHLHILDRLDDGARFPRGGVLVSHGKDDTSVPVEGSTALLEKVRNVDPSLNFHLELQPGDHGFDGSSSIDDEWLSRGLKELVASWLSKEGQN